MSVRDAVVEAARRQSGRRGPVHSPLYEYLWGDYEALVTELSPPRTPNWRAVAETLASKGILGGTPPRGSREPRTPTGDLVRRTWLKVVRDKQRQAEGMAPSRQARAQGKPQSTPSAGDAVPTPGVDQAITPTPPTDLPDDEEDLTFTAGDGTTHKVRIKK